jgi:hypothetical protein
MYLSSDIATIMNMERVEAKSFPGYKKYGKSIT